MVSLATLDWIQCKLRHAQLVKCETGSYLLRNTKGCQVGIKIIKSPIVY